MGVNSVERRPNVCGIIGYTGNRQAAPVLLGGLASLEYRGYDSAGIALQDSAGGPQVRKLAGKLADLRAHIGESLPEGQAGIGHTRWATHGAPTDENAHPHTDCVGDVVVAHNGIVENYADLRRQLTAQGHRFTSQTDSECIPHLIESEMASGLSFEGAVKAATSRMRGANALVAMSRREPGAIVGVRLGNAGGIVVGYCENEMLLASDLPALLGHANRVAYLENREMVTIRGPHAQFSTVDGKAVSKSPQPAPYDGRAAAKGTFRHYMLKEIHEQPEAAVDALRGRVDFDEMVTTLDEIPFTAADLAEIDRVIFVGMGTSLHAAMVGRMWMESFARIPSEADNASEFRYRNPAIDRRTLVVSISQSGETVDTLAAMEEAARGHARQLTLCNYAGAQSTRVADGALMLRAGPEIGVASTKTFVCSLLALYLLALHVGSSRGALSPQRARTLSRELAAVPDLLGRLVDDEERYMRLAARYHRCDNFLFLGRGVNYPLAMEGALKLKELSYIHAEGYPAGEMKHGPISLIDESMPVVALAPSDALYDKMLGNINEVRTRGGKLIAVTTADNPDILELVDDVIYMPEASPSLTPVLMAVPMQLLAYHIALRRGCDVDQPRNLAKSVTVE